MKLILYPNISRPVYGLGEANKGYSNAVVRASEIATFSISAGIHTNLAFNEKWSLALGANYMLTGWKTKTIETDGGIVGYRKYYTAYRIENIEVPVLLNRTIFKKDKINYYVVFGPSAWFNLFGKTIDVNANKSGDRITRTASDESDRYKNVNFAIMGGMGVEWMPNEEYGFFIQPTTQLSNTGMEWDADLSRGIFSFGVSIGVIFN